MNRSGEIPESQTLVCYNCDWQHTLANNSINSDQTLTQCLRCGNRDLWRQKNFPQSLGFLFVAAGAISSSVAIYYYRPLIAMGILMVFALLDMVLYIVMPDVLVCYRCQSKHHNVNVDAHGGFDHELGERYRQEKIRLAEASTEPPSPADKT